MRTRYPLRWRHWSHVHRTQDRPDRRHRITIAGTFFLTTAARRNATVDRVDFGARKTATTPAWDARVAPATEGGIKEFRIPITHDTIEIAKGVRYVGWTFGGTVPGPVMRVREGDLVRINLVNEAVGTPTRSTSMRRACRWIMP